MRPVQTHIPVAEFFRKDHHVAQVCLGDQRNAVDFFKIHGASEADTNAVTGIGAIGQQIFVFHRTDPHIFDAERLVFAEKAVRGRYQKGFRLNRECKSILAVGSADDGASVEQMRPE